jgi:predicted outer membrane repeat protein
MGRQTERWARALGVCGLMLATTIGGAAAVSPVAEAATAVTLYVRVGGTGTLCTATAPCGSVAQGVTVADALTGDAVTVTVGPGTYQTHDITIKATKIASLTISGAGATSTILDGQGVSTTLGGIIDATQGTVKLSGLTFEDGKASQTGGAVFASSAATVTVATDTFSTDSAREGGALASVTGTVVVVDDSFTNDHATTTGGAVYSTTATFDVTRSTFTGDAAPDGGAIYQTGGTTTLSTSTLSTDSATADGGAIEVNYLFAVSKVTNDTFFHDTADAKGGALYAQAGKVTIVDTTFSADTSPEAGVFVTTSIVTTTGFVSAKSSIFDGASCAGHKVTDAGYNVETGSSCGFGPSSINTSTTIDLAATLAPNRSTGPETLAITPASSAFQEVPLAACSVHVDERTKPRPGVGSACDAGAFELQTLTVPPSAVAIHRIYGSTAAGTAAAELEHAFTPSRGCPGTASTRPVVLATDQEFPDALSAAYLAKSLSTGILLTGSASLSSPTATALRKEGITHVFVVGGPLAVSTAVVSELEALPVYRCGGGTETGAHLTVTRIAGQSAYDTAAAVAESVPSSFVGSVDLSGAYASTNATGGLGRDNTTAGNASSAPGVLGAQRTAILATGTSFSDAEAASVLSYADDLPILLTTPGSLSSQAQAAISALHVTQVIVMGGPLAVSDAVVAELEANGISVLRVAGKDATTTAVQLADLEVGQRTTDLGFGWAQGHHLDGIVVARGTFFSDGLAGAPLAARGGYSGTGPEPLVLTESPDILGPFLTAFLRMVGHAGIDHDGIPIDTLTILGGPDAVTPSAVAAMEAALR